MRGHNFSSGQISWLKKLSGKVSTPAKPSCAGGSGGIFAVPKIQSQVLKMMP